MFETLFELLFKYRPLLYERGDLAFSAPPAWLLGLGAGLGAVAVVSYLAARGRSARRDRALLAGLRLSLLAVLLLLLSRPVLLLPSVVPQENYLAVLVDDSRSMRLDDGASRAAFVQDAFLDPASELRRALASSFRLRFYRFSDVAERLSGDEELDFAGSRTRLGRALERVRDDLSSLPLSGLVLVTDGADGAPAELDDAMAGLLAGGVPVFPVGVGSESFRRDIEVSRVSVPRRALVGSTVTAEVVLEHSGVAGRTVTLQVEQGGRLAGSTEVRLGDDGATTVSVDFTAREPGAQPFRFRVPVENGELVDRNNERETTVEVRDGAQKILYFEGEPRHEVAFLRRAVAPDPNLQLVVLQRSDEGRYLRLEVNTPDELAGGFPSTREELFAYRALVLGSIEASHFTHDQLAMIAEFVERRGGGLLMLGGRGALAEGGWAGTPVAGALPVRLEASEAADSSYHAPLRVELTRAGRRHPITRLEGDDVTPWESLPPLTAFNRPGPLKPGASALLTAPAPGGAGEQVVLAHQRFGRGRAAVFAVQDSWIWQMDAAIPLEDQTHERLWRQLLRWLVAETPDRLVAELPVEPVGAGEPFEIRAGVRDGGFGPVNHASVVATVETPSGGVAEVPLQWSLGRDGEYTGRFVPTEDGPHVVRLAARHDSVTLESGPGEVRVAPEMDEYFGARMRRPALERIAEETGGRFYDPASVATLPEDITYTARGVTVIEELELWDAPAAFLAVLLLASLEWMVRRRRGLA